MKTLRTFQQKLRKVLILRNIQPLPCDFSEFPLLLKNNHILQQNQRQYMNKSESFEKNTTCLQFRSVHMRLDWHLHTRPNCLF